MLKDKICRQFNYHFVEEEKIDLYYDEDNDCYNIFPSPGNERDERIDDETIFGFNIYDVYEDCEE